MPRSRSPTPLSSWPLPVYTQRASNGSSSSHSSLASTSGRSSTSPFASQRSSATTLGSPSLDEIAPSYPLVDAAQSSDGKTRHLPHLLAFTAAVNLTKPSVSVVLAEPLVYIRPPGAGLAGLEEDPEQAEGGRNGRLTGFVNVASPTARTVKGLRIVLSCTQRLLFPEEGGRLMIPEDVECFRKELYYTGDGGRLHLEGGVSTFEFFFEIPSYVPAINRPKNAPTCNRQSCLGWTKWEIVSTLEGSGSWLQKDLSASTPVCIISYPHWDDPNTVTFQHYHEADSPFLGPFSLSLFSSEFIISGPCRAEISFLAPPPRLTIFAINVFLEQTTTVTSPTDPTKTRTVKGSKVCFLQAGEKKGYAGKTFARDARAKGTVLLDAKRAGAEEMESWEWSMLGRLPDETKQQPTTQQGTRTNLRHWSTLGVEVVFSLLDDNGVDGEIQIGKMYSKDINLASCCCSHSTLTLPSYEDASASEPSRKQTASTGPLCACQTTTSALFETELAIIRGGTEGLAREGLVPYQPRLGELFVGGGGGGGNGLTLGLGDQAPKIGEEY